MRDANASSALELEAAGLAPRPMLDALTAEPFGDERLGLVGRVSGGRADRHPRAARGRHGAGDRAHRQRPQRQRRQRRRRRGAALRANELIFLSDVPGVVGPGGDVIRRITPAAVAELIAAGHVSGGMIPKLDAGLAALAGGVWRVWIGAETMVTA